MTLNHSPRKKSPSPLDFSAPAQSDHEARPQCARTPRPHQQGNVHERSVSTSEMLDGIIARIVPFTRERELKQKINDLTHELRQTDANRECLLLY